MKQVVGTLTDEEREELRRTPRFVGGEEPGTGVLVVYAPMTQEEWEELYGGLRSPTTPEGWAERTCKILGDDVPDVSDARS